MSVPDPVPLTPAGIARGLAAGTPWVWFLADGAEPRPEAFARLRAGLVSEDESPAAIAAGLVVDSAGRPRDEYVGFSPRGRVPDLLRLAERRMLPLSSTPLTHALVARASIERHGSPDFARYGVHAALAWTRRILREEPGYLVPGSVAVLARPPRGRLVDLPATVRMARAGVWTRGETAAALRRVIAGTAFGR